VPDGIDGDQTHEGRRQLDRDFTISRAPEYQTTNASLYV
jgi:hypothetical protein